MAIPEAVVRLDGLTPLAVGIVAAALAEGTEAELNANRSDVIATVQGRRTSEGILENGTRIRVLQLTDEGRAQSTRRNGPLCIGRITLGRSCAKGTLGADVLAASKKGGALLDQLSGWGGRIDRRRSTCGRRGLRLCRSPGRPREQQRCDDRGA
jgi:hypothetical protein